MPSNITIPYNYGGSGRQSPFTQRPMTPSSFWDLYGQGVMNSAGAEGGALYQPGTPFDPSYQPKTNLDALIQTGLSPLFGMASGVRSVVDSVAGLPAWLQAPIAQGPDPQALGGDISSLFSQYLQRYGAGDNTPGPKQEYSLGKAPQVPQLPKAPTYSAPDYTKARESLIPPDYPESLDRLQAPHKMTPEEEQQLVQSGLLGGIAQGFFNAPDDAFLGHKLLAAGVGAVGGLGGAKEGIYERKRGEEKETQDYWMKRADMEQRINQQNMEYSAAQSGLDARMAEGVANAANQTAQAEYTRSLEQAKLEIENAQLNRPRLMGMTSYGFMLQTTDPQTGETKVTTYPLGKELTGTGLMGGGLLNDAYGLSSTFGTGGVDTATMLIHQLRQFGGPGALSSVFGEDALNDVMETIAGQLDPTLQSYGTQGQRYGLMQKMSAENFALGQILLTNPDALKRALELLVNRGIPQGE